MKTNRQNSRRLRVFALIAILLFSINAVFAETASQAQQSLAQLEQQYYLYTMTMTVQQVERIAPHSKAEKVEYPIKIDGETKNLTAFQVEKYGKSKRLIAIRDLACHLKDTAWQFDAHFNTKLAQYHLAHPATVDIAKLSEVKRTVRLSEYQPDLYLNERKVGRVMLLANQFYVVDSELFAILNLPVLSENGTVVLNSTIADPQNSLKNRQVEEKKQRDPAQLAIDNNLSSKEIETNRRYQNILSQNEKNHNNSLIDHNEQVARLVELVN